MSEERNQESAPAQGAASNLSSTSTPSVGRISAPLPPPRTIPFGPGMPTPPPRPSALPSAAPPPPSRRPKPMAPPSVGATSNDDAEELDSAAMLEPPSALESSPELPSSPIAQPSAPSQVSAPRLDPASSAPSFSSTSAHSAPSIPGTPSLDQVFSADDDPESQDGAILTAGRVLSQPIEGPSVDPSTDFDDEEDEETRVLDTRDLGLSRRVDSSLKSALRSSVAPPPPPGASRPITQGPPSRLSNAPPMSVPPVRPPAAMPPPSGPPGTFGQTSRFPHVPPAAPAPGSHPLSSAYPPGFINPEASAPYGTVSQLPPATASAPAPAKAKWPWIAVLAAFVAAAGTWFLLGSKGDLLISVSGPANAAVTGVKIYVNGEQVCDQSPCQVNGLKPGPYTVRAEAPGHVTSADQAVKVESGSSAVANIQLRGDDAQPQLTVTTTGAGLRVLVDGRDRGTAPLELSGLSPGTHTVRVEGPGFEAIEQTITITEGASVSVGPLSPKLLKGSLRIELGKNAEGAQVLVNGKGVRSLPATVELDAATSHDLLVRKIGYADYQRTISFTPAEPKVDLTIDLEEGSSELGGGRHSGGTRPATESPAAADTPSSKPDFLSTVKGDKAATAAPKPADKPQASGPATLNINSVPPTTVLLNGRPLGKTPKTGVSVPAGSHTITFIHPDKGRKSVKVDVPAGGSKNVTIRL